MEHKIFAIFDMKAKAYRFPMFQQYTGNAIRSFTTAANDKSTEIGMYPEDFCLYELGTINLLNGEVKGCEPVNLGLAIGFKDVSNG